MPIVSSDVYSEIASVVARYADYCDHNQWDEASRLFTSDGVFDAEQMFGQVVVGTDAIREFMSTRPAPIAHHPTSFFVEKATGDEYSVRMKMLVVFDGAISSIDFAWLIAPEAGDLKIKRQEIAMVGRVRTGPPKAKAVS